MKIGRLFVIGIMLLFYSMNANATSHTIGASGQDFTTVQDAIDDAGVVNGDTLYIVDPVLTEGDIMVDKNLVIIGIGTVEGSIIQADADSGVAPTNVMNIGSVNTVVLINLTIQHGVSEEGGGIENAGYLEMYNCLVQKNVSTYSSSSGGGGIDNETRLMIYQTDFINNYSGGHGGAINMNDDGSLFAEGCSFINNYADYGGGAIGMPYGDTLYIDHCIFDGNYANDGQGGAILDGGGNSDEIIYIGNSQFRNNTADQNGGAIHLYMDSTLIENCIIEDNEAYSDGGGIYLYSGNLLVENCTIQRNEAGDGGAIYNNDMMQVRNCIIQDNIANSSTSGGGGGIYNEYMLWVSETEFIHDTASNGHGGAMNNDNSSAVLYADKCTFTGNYAEYGGGAIAMPYGDTLHIDSCAFDGNTAYYGQGGAILDGGGDDDEIIYIGNSVFRNNRAEDNRGGAIHLYMDSTLIENCLIEDNYTNDDGGGIYSYYGDLTINNCTIQRNESENNGGGVYFNNDVLTINNCMINDNISNDEGGGINTSSADVMIDSTIIDGNTSVNGGGGFAFDGNIFQLTNSIIRDNSTENDGGGGALIEYGDILIDNCLIEGNSTEDGGGGGFAIWYADTVTIANSSIVNNSTAKRGGGINIYDCDIYIFNTSITDNQAIKTGGGINGTGRVLYLDFVTIANNTSGDAGGGLNVFMSDDEYLFDSVLIKNSVIANNNDGINSFTDIADDSLRIISLGYNLIGNTDSCEFVNNAEGDIYGDPIGTTTANAGATEYNEAVDPRLGDLMGGTDELKYRKPRSCSPLIDAADDNSILDIVVLSDMLGETRPIGGGQDIGAIETDASIVGGTSVATVSGVTLTGFSVAMNPAIDYLLAADFSLDNSGVITAATTSDDGGHYAVTTNTLTEDVTYALTIDDGCFDISVSGDDIFVHSITDVTATVSGVTTTGFTVAMNPAVDGLVAGNFSLNHSGNVTGAVTADNGITYTITTAELTMDVTYTLEIDEEFYSFTVTGNAIIVVSSDLAINQSNEINLYPNPASANIYLKGLVDQGFVTIKIVDLSGQVVQLLELNSDKEIEIDISALNCGMYMMQVISNDKVYETRFIIE